MHHEDRYSAGGLGKRRVVANEGDAPAVRGSDHLAVVTGKRTGPQHDVRMPTREVANDDVGVLDEGLTVWELTHPAGRARKDDAMAVRHERDLALVDARGFDVRWLHIARRGQPAQLRAVRPDRVDRTDGVRWHRLKAISDPFGDQSGWSSTVPTAGKVI